MFDSLVTQIRRWAERVSFPNHFLTLYLRPIIPGSYDWLGYYDRPRESWAIVIQGPIEPKSDYTVETARAYRSWFPEASIIISTWSDESGSTLSELKQMGCEVVISDSRENVPWDSNVNRQMITSYAGIRRAQDLGCQYAAKTRSDQRVRNPHSFLALRSLLALYPQQPNSTQQARLVVPSLDTFALRLYGVSDHFMYGHITDLLNFWSGELDFRRPSNGRGNLEEYARQRIAEVFFATSFLERIGEPLEWTLAHYWRVLGERFIVVDSMFLDLHWPKYTDIENRWGWNDSAKFREVSHAAWLAMLRGEYRPDEALLRTIR